MHTDRDNWLSFLVRYKVKEAEMEQNKKSTSSESSGCYVYIESYDASCVFNDIVRQTSGKKKWFDF